MKVLKKRANVPVETSMSSWMGYDDDHIYTMGFVHEKLKQPQFHMMKVPSTTLCLKYVLALSFLPPSLPPSLPACLSIYTMGFVHEKLK